MSQPRGTHTPAPWDAIEDAILADDGCVEVAAVPLHDGMNPTEWQANAHLIAAAPDLYEALKAVVERIEASAAVNREGVTGAAYSVWMASFDDGSREDWCDVFNAAEAAIAKAEGRS